jgi:hypothetical protein
MADAHPLRSLTLKRAAAIAFALAAFSASNASADLIVNGGFEDPVIANNSFSYLPSIPGWTLASGPAIEIQNHVAGSPFAGQQFVELDSSANSSMYQDLTTVAGQTYRLSFVYSPRPGVAESSNGIDVQWDGSDLGVIKQTGIGHPDTVWTLHSFDLLATSSTTRLQFTAVGTSDSLGGYLDAVSVNAVPEPSVLALSGIAGLGCLAVRRWAKRKTQASPRV